MGKTMPCLPPSRLEMVYEKTTYVFMVIFLGDQSSWLIGIPLLDLLDWSTWSPGLPRPINQAKWGLPPASAPARRTSVRWSQKGCPNVMAMKPWVYVYITMVYDIYIYTFIHYIYIVIYLLLLYILYIKIVYILILYCSIVFYSIW